MICMSCRVEDILLNQLPSVIGDPFGFGSWRFYITASNMIISSSKCFVFHFILIVCLKFSFDYMVQFLDPTPIPLCSQQRLFAVQVFELHRLIKVNYDTVQWRVLLQNRNHVSFSCTHTFGVHSHRLMLFI